MSQLDIPVAPSTKTRVKQLRPNTKARRVDRSISYRDTRAPCGQRILHPLSIATRVIRIVPQREKGRLADVKTAHCDTVYFLSNRPAIHHLNSQIRRIDRNWVRAKIKRDERRGRAVQRGGSGDCWY